MSLLAETISHSEVESYSRCQKAHLFSYGMGLTSIEPNVFLQTGNAFHELAEIYYKALKAGAEGTEAFIEANTHYMSLVLSGKYETEFLNTAHRLFKDYVDFYDWREWEVLMVEGYFEFPLTDEITFNGHIDLVVRFKNGPHVGKLGVVDHKTGLNFMNQVQVDMHSQIPKYIYVLNSLPLFDQSVKVGVINQARWRKVTNPIDQFSRREITPTALEQDNIIKNHIKWCNRIVERRKFPIHDWHEEATLTEIKDICKFCDFATPCKEERAGKDSSTTLMNYFRPRDTTYREQRTPIHEAIAQI